MTNSYLTSIFFNASTSHDFNACTDDEKGSQKLQNAQSDVPISRLSFPNLVSFVLKLMFFL